MGTATRFITALGGVALIVFALVLLGRPIIQTIAASESTDFPGGAAGFVVLMLLVGSLPFGGGVLLIRRAVRGGPGTPAPHSPVADVVEPAPVAVAVAADTPAPSPQTTRETVSVAPPGPRRIWMAMLGLTMAIGVLLFDAVIVLGAFSDGSLSQGANAVILVVVLLLSAVPLFGGLRLAHRGDPGMGRRFITDLGTGIGQLRRPARLVGSSAGLAFVTAIVGLWAMIAWRDAAPSIGPYALTFFSLIDPLANVLRHRSWWAGAFVSAASWFVLFLVMAMATDIASDRPDVSIRFIQPLLAYPAAMALSGLIRFLQWLGRR